MNKKLEAFARKTLKENLSKLPESNQRIFKLMYGREDGKTVEQTEATYINDVVDQMPVEKLSWAMTQVDNSLEKVK